MRASEIEARTVCELAQSVNRIKIMSTFMIGLRSMFALALLLVCSIGSFAQNAGGSDVVMVLPFENTSSHPEYNWVGESFADSLAELLSKPGLLVVSSDEREMAYQRLRVPEIVIPSRATAIKLAREAKASMIVIGT